MKKAYEKPVIAVTIFDKHDIYCDNITESDTVTGKSGGKSYNNIINSLGDPTGINSFGNE